MTESFSTYVISRGVLFAPTKSLGTTHRMFACSDSTHALLLSLDITKAKSSGINPEFLSFTVAPKGVGHKSIRNVWLATPPRGLAAALRFSTPHARQAVGVLCVSNFVVAPRGIEPSLADLEAAVLPLNYSPVLFTSSLIFL